MHLSAQMCPFEKMVQRADFALVTKITSIDLLEETFELPLD